jgi:5-(carboxyamino)imidazole ribonucleotide synthase
MKPLPPNSWLAMLGGGQLGRMFCFAAQSLGYRVCVLDPDADSPAGRVADKHLLAAYDDEAALQWIKSYCQAATTEFENVPAIVLEQLAGHMPVCPGAQAVSVAQNRIAEKTFIQSTGVPVAPFVVLLDKADLAEIPPDIFPAILKTARMGYDGKGQVTVLSQADLAPAWQQLGEVACVLEKRLPLMAECSVVLARDTLGNITSFDVAENVHHQGILAQTVLPARLPGPITQAAQLMAATIAQQLGYEGVLCVELFVLRDGSLVVNEMAPRPHNSGHPTIEACATSQFEQQVRVMAGLPLGSVALVQPAVMLNLLGDSWQAGEPAWEKILALPNTHLHLYSKAQARPGRKMGHLTVCAATLGEALLRADECAQHLGLARPH